MAHDVMGLAALFFIFCTFSGAVTQDRFFASNLNEIKDVEMDILEVDANLTEIDEPEKVLPNIDQIDRNNEFPRKVF